MLLAAVIMSTPEVVLKSIQGVFAPLQLCSERVLTGAVFLLPFAFREMKKRGDRVTAADLQKYAMLGFIMVPLHMSLQQLAVNHIDASAVAAIFSGNPVFTLLLAHLILHEPLKKNHIFAILLQLAGILFIISSLNAKMDLRGMTEILVSTAIYSMLTVLSKPMVSRYGSIVSGCLNLLFGSLELLFILLLGHIPAVASVFRSAGLDMLADVPLLAGFSAVSIIPFLYVGMVCAGYGYVIIMKVIEYTSATESSFIYLIKPILSSIIAAFVLGEQISAGRRAGIVCSVLASLSIILPLLWKMRQK